MSNFTTFNLNDMVFVDNVGYGVLMECGDLKSLAVVSAPSSLEKKQSIYFDPDLFNSQTDIIPRQKSEQAIIVPQKSEKDPHLQQKNEAQPAQCTDQPAVEKEVKINIVKVRLEGGAGLVYTPHTTIRKYVIVPVRPLFLPALGKINVRIEIGKTIESFKKEIFDFLGLKHFHYFNVKLFTTNPQLSELNSASKTVWQYGLRESSTLTMTAQHGFCFESIPSHLTEFFSLANNNLTLISLPKKPKVVQNVVIAQPAAQPNKPTADQASPVNLASQPVDLTSPPTEQVSPPSEQVSPPAESQPLEGNASGENPSTLEKKETVVVETKVEEKEPPETILVKGDKILRSGKQYFEVKLDKLPQTSSHLQIGIYSTQSPHRWIFSPLLQQKSHIERQQQQQPQSQSLPLPQSPLPLLPLLPQDNKQQQQQQKEEKQARTQAYGMSVKQGDVIGLYAKMEKNRKLRVIFYKNNVNMGLCFDCAGDEFGFVFQIGSEAQISIDTRVQPPIDLYRFR